MKKIIGALTICVLFFTGCDSNAYQNVDKDMKKQSKIEIYSIQNDELLESIDNQETIKQLLEVDHWETVNSLPDDLIPEYKLLIYQEKTLLYGQNPNEESDYELVATITTFQNSSYVEEVIPSDVVKNMIIPEDAMTFYYSWSNDTIEQFHGLFK